MALSRLSIIKFLELVRKTFNSFSENFDELERARFYESCGFVVPFYRLNLFNIPTNSRLILYSIRLKRRNEGESLILRSQNVWSHCWIVRKVTVCARNGKINLRCNKTPRAEPSATARFAYTMSHCA